MDDAAPSQREIIELHEYFEALFLGRTDSLDRARDAFDDDFTMVGPHGAMSNRAEVLAQLEAGYAHTTELRIEIPHTRLIAETDALVIAEYVEVHHLREGRHNERVTTVVFRKDPGGPNNLRWLHAQETFITNAPAS